LKEPWYEAVAFTDTFPLMTKPFKKRLFSIGGLVDERCGARSEQAVLQFRAVRYAGVSVSRGVMLLSADDDFDIDEALAAVRLLGFTVEPCSSDDFSPEQDEYTSKS
jgi:hypothetical protein